VIVGEFSSPSIGEMVHYSLFGKQDSVVGLRFSLDKTKDASSDDKKAWPQPRWFFVSNSDRAVSVAFEWLCEADALFVSSFRSTGFFSVDLRGPMRVPGVGVFSNSALVAPLFLQPIDLNDLYPFQRIGVRWLLDKESGVLADDMGLGKTVQAIFAIRELIRCGKARRVLVICPKTLVSNWIEELLRWAPELLLARTTSLFGSAFRAVALRAHVLVANYEQIRFGRKEEGVCGVDVLLADEAHRLRNEESRVSLGFRKIQRGRTWLLTGTPLERDLNDVVVLLSLTNPLRFSPDDSRLTPDLVRRLAEPFVLRRTKAQVLSELPRVHDATEELRFLEGQREAYLRVMSAGPIGGNVLSLLNQLRSICDLEPETDESSKVIRTLEIVHQAFLRGEKTVVFSFLLRPLKVLKRCLNIDYGVRFSAVLEGEMSSDERDNAVSRFCKEGGPAVLLASTRVSGEGLTLTVANNVVFFNQWWNPSTNDQARDRVVRIGQTRECFIHRLMIKNSVEEALERILRKKSCLMNTVVEGFSKPERPDFPLTSGLAQEVLEESILYVEEGKLAEADQR